MKVNMSSSDILILANAQRLSKVLAILYDGGKAAQEEPRLLGTTENRLGIEGWLKSQGHELIGKIAHSLVGDTFHSLPCSL